MKAVVALLLVCSIACAPGALAAGGLDLAATGRPAADLARDANAHPAQVLAIAGIESGMTIADVFAGSGYFSELAAQLVAPAGRVLLHNNAAYLAIVHEALEERLRDDRLPLVTRHDAEADALGFAPGSLDGVLLMLAFHDFYFSDRDWAVTADQVMPQLHAALKAGGFLLVIDHAAEPGTGTHAAQALHRIDELSARAAIESFGFSFDGSSDVLRNPDDDRTQSAFAPALRGRTDRFVHRYLRKD